MKLRWPSADHIYLSPHPDDVVLSCGGMIAQQAQHGESVAVITVFAASPSLSFPLSDFAHSLHDRWLTSAQAARDFADPPALRRAEDSASWAALSPAIHLAHFPLTDCIYRHHPYTGEPLYASEAAIFGSVHPADPARAVLETLGPPPESVRLYCPLAVGNHVDHQVVRQIVEGWGLHADQVRYYEDVPYAMHTGAVDSVIGQHNGWVPISVPLEAADLEAKIAAIAKHASQISSFWESHAVMAEALQSYSDSVGGERLWIKGGLSYE